jgi:hypothetical protein
MKRYIPAVSVGLLVLSVASGARAQPTAPAGADATEQVAAPTEEDAAARLARMRVILGASDQQSRARRRWSAITQLGTTALLTGPAVYMAIDDGGRSPAEEAFAAWLIFASIPYGVPGLFALAGSFLDGPEAKLGATAATRADGAAATLARVDHAWEREAAAARSIRRQLGIGGLVIAGIDVAVATVLLAIGAPGSNAHGMAAGLYVAAALGVGFGAYELTTETPIESSYRTWRGLEPSPPRMAAAAAVAPAPGGGAIASLRLAF